MNTDPSTSPVNVTIPCSSCGESIRFAERECAGCGVKVSQAERDALDRRLEASSSDYRDLRKETDAGRTVMFIVAALHLLMAGVSIFVSEGEGGVIASAYYALVGSGFALATWLAQRNAVTAFLVPAALWAALQMALLVLNPLGVGPGMLPQLVVLALLARATWAAFKIRKYLASMRSGEHSPSWPSCDMDAER